MCMETKGKTSTNSVSRFRVVNLLKSVPIQHSGHTVNTSYHLTVDGTPALPLRGHVVVDGETGAGKYATVIRPICEAKCMPIRVSPHLETASCKQRGNEVKLVSRHTYPSSPED
ncbi:unnamed protein product [Danaus chrysippus]|uniref:(African queen) hypothetical protein n=1 Tax=Danaus chrysippus TaxID=151541 RepID=A0A8J2W1W9_9NEOP|nr:unnamed protein product [Danaus chrysippus]